ncbi:MAG: hypothetical protein J5811_02385, partial [Lachnospiraceae bacterium]|nr:hypothetical protein [Lachnospiraceae bacterium]
QRASGKADMNVMMYEPGNLPYDRYRSYVRVTSNWPYCRTGLRYPLFLRASVYSFRDLGMSFFVPSGDGMRLAQSLIPDESVVPSFLRKIKTKEEN